MGPIGRRRPLRNERINAAAHLVDGPRISPINTKHHFNKHISFDEPIPIPLSGVSAPLREASPGFKSKSSQVSSSGDAHSHNLPRAVRLCPAAVTRFTVRRRHWRAALLVARGRSCREPDPPSAPGGHKRNYSPRRGGPKLAGLGRSLGAGTGGRWRRRHILLSNSEHAARGPRCISCHGYWRTTHMGLRHQQTPPTAYRDYGPLRQKDMGTQ